MEHSTNGTLKKKKEKFLEALKEAKGNVSYACKISNIPRRTYYNWLKNEKFKNEVEDVKEEAIEFVENKLMERIEVGDLGAIIFFLKTKGKHRGWSEKIEVKHENQAPVINLIGVDVNNEN